MEDEIPDQSRRLRTSDSRSDPRLSSLGPRITSQALPSLKA